MHKLAVTGKSLTLASQVYIELKTEYYLPGCMITDLFLREAHSVIVVGMQEAIPCWRPIDTGISNSPDDGF